MNFSNVPLPLWNDFIIKNLWNPDFPQMGFLEKKQLQEQQQLHMSKGNRIAYVGHSPVVQWLCHSHTTLTEGIS